MELREMLMTYKQELFNLRFQEVTKQLGNPKRIRFVRKAIARILTAQRERELAGAEA
jgi:large subunit ribosomal protein L29